MHKNFTFTGEDEAAIACDRPVLSSRSGDRRVSCEIIPFPQAATAALVGFEDEASSFDDPVSIGELAVRIVARWSLPRIYCEVREGEQREEHSPSL